MASIGIQSIHCYDFELSLAQPFFVRSEEIKARKGVIIHVFSEFGHMGFGEVSPLPGISRESLQKAVHQLDVLRREFKGERAPLEPAVLLKWLAGHLPDETICPSVKFGFESAIISMVAAVNNKSIFSFLTNSVENDVFSAGLLQGTPEMIIRQARFLAAKGYKTFKLKVGSRNIPLDVRKVDDLRSVLGPDVKLRLDANRAWRLDEAVVFAQSIGKDRIEYIEEPLANPLQLEQFVRGTDMSIAVDETLGDIPLDDLADRMGVRYVIVRPMTMGGVSGFLELLKAASGFGLQVVVASAFETGIGMTALVNLAGMSTAVANLGSSNWFEQDLLLRPVMLNKGRIPVDRFQLAIKFFHADLAEKLQAT